MAQDEQHDGDVIASVKSFLEDYSKHFPSEETPGKRSTAKEDDALMFTEIDTLTDDDELMDALATVSSITKRSINESKANMVVQGDTNTSQTGTAAQENGKGAERKVRYRRKLKRERETLSKQNVELSRELERLQVARAEKNREEAQCLALTVWKTIATQQKEKRLKAEEQQKWLRAAVISRSRVIEQMNSFLQSSDPARNMALCGHESVEASTGGSALPQTFVNELDLLYLQTDQIIRQTNFSVSSSMGFSLTQKCCDGFKYYECVDATTVPFGFEQTAQAMLSLMMSGWCEGFLKKEVKKPECTMGCTYNGDYCLESGDVAPLELYSAVRRYHEADRAVFVWHVLTEGQGDYAGLHASETRWMVFRPSATNSTTSLLNDDSEVSTVVELYSRVVQTGRSSPVVADRFTEVVGEMGEDGVVEMMEMLEKMLLEKPEN